MAKSKEVSILNDANIVVKAKTFTGDGDFAGPFFMLGIGGGAAFAAITGMLDLFIDYNTLFTPQAYLWSLIPMLNVFVIWPVLYGSNAETILQDRGYKNEQISFWRSIIAWYKIPSLTKRKFLRKSYIRVNSYNADKLQGNLYKQVVPMGEATHEVNDYLIMGTKGIRFERQIEPTPLYLWDDALKTVDEGFGVPKLTSR